LQPTTGTKTRPFVGFTFSERDFEIKMTPLSKNNATPGGKSNIIASLGWAPQRSAQWAQWNRAL